MLIAAWRRDIEVGNETYGCWEVNDEPAGPPENELAGRGRGIVRGRPGCVKRLRDM